MVCLLSSAGKGWIAFCVCLFVLNLGRGAESTCSQGRVMEGSMLLQMFRTGNGDFVLCGQSLWHPVNLLPPCFKRRNTAEQPVHSGTNLAFKLNSVFLWLQNLLRVPFPHRFISPPVNSVLCGNPFWDKNQSARNLALDSAVWEVHVYSKFQTQGRFHTYRSVITCFQKTEISI